MGRLEASVESLELKWTNYRDEIKKLVTRLEKREERLEKKIRESADSEPVVNNIPDVDDFVDVVTQRVNARRAKNGVFE